MRGFCLTTGMLVGNAPEIALLTERYRVLHISDEAHHNGTDLDWGGPPFHFEILDGMGHLASAIIDGKTYSAEEIAEAEAHFADDPRMKGQPSVTKMGVFAWLKSQGKL